MAITSEQLATEVLLILYKDRTHGGGTYYLDGRPTCLAQTSAKGNELQHCTQAAGYRTEHPGTGRCYFHGGSGSGPHLTHGRYAHATASKLKLQYEQFANDPDVLDLVPELILLRSLLAKMVSMYEDAQPSELMEQPILTMLLKIIESIGKNVERIENISSKHTLTVTNAKYIMLLAMNVAQKYVAQDQIPQFIDEWRREVLSPISMTKYIEGEVVR